MTSTTLKLKLRLWPALRATRLPSPPGCSPKALSTEKADAFSVENAFGEHPGGDGSRVARSAGHRRSFSFSVVLVMQVVGYAGPLPFLHAFDYNAHYGD